MRRARLTWASIGVEATGNNTECIVMAAVITFAVCVAVAASNPLHNSAARRKYIESGWKPQGPVFAYPNEVTAGTEETRQTAEIDPRLREDALQTQATTPANAESDTANIILIQKYTTEKLKRPDGKVEVRTYVYGGVDNAEIVSNVTQILESDEDNNAFYPTVKPKLIPITEDDTATLIDVSKHVPMLSKHLKELNFDTGYEEENETTTEAELVTSKKQERSSLFNLLAEDAKTVTGAYQQIKKFEILNRSSRSPSIDRWDDGTTADNSYKTIQYAEERAQGNGYDKDYDGTYSNTPPASYETEVTGTKSCSDSAYFRPTPVPSKTYEPPKEKVSLMTIPFFPYSPSVLASSKPMKYTPPKTSYGEPDPTLTLHKEVQSARLVSSVQELPLEDDKSMENNYDSYGAPRNSATEQPKTGDCDDDSKSSDSQMAAVEILMQNSFAKSYKVKEDGTLVPDDKK